MKGFGGCLGLATTRLAAAQGKKEPYSIVRVRRFDIAPNIGHPRLSYTGEPSLSVFLRPPARRGSIRLRSCKKAQEVFIDPPLLISATKGRFIGGCEILAPQRRGHRFLCQTFKVFLCGFIVFECTDLVSRVSAEATVCVLPHPFFFPGGSIQLHFCLADKSDFREAWRTHDAANPPV